MKDAQYRRICAEPCKRQRSGHWLHLILQSFTPQTRRHHPPIRSERVLFRCVSIAIISNSSQLTSLRGQFMVQTRSTLQRMFSIQILSLNTLGVPEREAFLVYLSAQTWQRLSCATPSQQSSSRSKSGSPKRVQERRIQNSSWTRRQAFSYQIAIVNVDHYPGRLLQEIFKPSKIYFSSTPTCFRRPLLWLSRLALPPLLDQGRP